MWLLKNVFTVETFLPQFCAYVSTVDFKITVEVGYASADESSQRQNTSYDGLQ